MRSDPSEDHRSQFKDASDEFGRARATIEIFCRPDAKEALAAFDDFNAKASLGRIDRNDWHSQSVIFLAMAATHLIEIAREDLGTDR